MVRCWTVIHRKISVLCPPNDTGQHRNNNNQAVDNNNNQ